tara:strand:- start:562 stop:696 length:135 start_codon:yes stop_codon:yes gene_type:complete
MNTHDIMVTIIGSAAAIIFFIGAFGAAKQHQTDFRKGKDDKDNN